MNRIDELIERYPVLAPCKNEIIGAVDALTKCYQIGGKLLVCGNGGSAADALHIVGELMKSFVLPRRLCSEECDAIKESCPDADYLCRNLEGALPAIALVNEVSLQSAYANDATPDLAFAQQVYGYGNKGDVLVCISTSGNSQNAVYAAEVARAKGLSVVSLTGMGGGKLKEFSDITIAVPEKETFKVQELHLPVYHAICLEIEDRFFGED